MKTLTLFVTLAVGFSSAFAQAASIKQDMKQIGTLVKQIAAGVNDPSQNQNSAALAAQIITLFQDTYVQAPDVVSALPADQQAAAQAQYQQMIQEEINDAAQLQSALLNNDNASAVAILQQMNQTKTDGHNEFNP